MMLTLAIVFSVAQTTAALFDLASIYESNDVEHTVYRGFPVGVLCSNALPFLFTVAHDTTMYTKCIIYKSGVVIYNRTIDGSTRIQEMGVFDKADDSWDGVTVNVTALTASGDNTRFKETYVTLEEPTNFDCVNARDIDYNERRWSAVLNVGESEVLNCHHSHGDNNEPVVIQLTEDLKPNYTVWWYKGCERINRDDPEYEYVKDQYQPNEMDGTVYASLRVRRATFTSTPGIYSCVLKINDGENSTSNTFHLSSMKLCVKREYNAYDNFPIVKMMKRQYTVTAGDDLMIQAAGILAADPRSLSGYVEWFRMRDRKRVCNSFNTEESPKCLLKRHENKRYCEPIPEDEVLNVYKDYMGNNFTANYWIRNAGKEDEGSYIVRYSRFQNTVEDTFTVRVVDVAPDLPGGIAASVA